MKFHIVLTTIYNPKVLHNYAENIKQFGRQDSTKIWVIADKKTPPECEETCKYVSASGVQTIFVSIEDQIRWAANFPGFLDVLPYNNDTRRNIGYALALEDQCEVLISIDDDNYPTNDDFIGWHSTVGSMVDAGIVEESGYHNICEYISFSPERPIYPRGYPFALRDERNRPTKQKIKGGLIGINAGLWLESPDVDATTWLNGTIKGISYNGPDQLILQNSTWSPVNTQNTAIIRDLIPYYFCVPMGYAVPGGIIHRYGDIWGGYLALAVMEHTKYNVSFGRPIANHFRNPHDYLTDLRQEFWGILLTDWLISQIKGFRPDIDDIHKRADALLGHIDYAIKHDLPEWCPPEVQKFLNQTLIAFGTYINVCRKII